MEVMEDLMDANDSPIPGPDAIKLFIGGIPKDYFEEEMRGELERFGVICRLKVLRDPFSGHRGLSGLPGAEVPAAAASSMLGGAPAPDKDSIKLFVGQVPRSHDEADLRQIFEKYGTICDLKVLKDPYTGFHRGCCFVTFQRRAEAEACMDALHDKVSLGSMGRKLQVKPADENKMERRKLFIGMLPKEYDTQKLRALLEQFGTVEECNILKDENGLSRSCGFALMKRREECDAAINALHNIRKIGSSKSPLQVKFADTDRDRTAKRYQKAAAAAYGGLPFIPGIGGGQLPTAASATPTMALYQQIAALHTLLNNTSAAGATAGPATGAATDQATLANLALYQQLIAGGVPVPQAATQQGQQYPQQKEGPDGANLFIYHIPAEFRDADLVQMFSPFGTVLSARVYIDKATNQSKCFGFVSYSTPEAAQNAITSMNGFQIGTKRLKVSHKKSPRSMHMPY